MSVEIAQSFEPDMFSNSPPGEYGLYISIRPACEEQPKWELRQRRNENLDKLVHMRFMTLIEAIDDDDHRRDVFFDRSERVDDEFRELVFETLARNWGISEKSVLYSLGHRR
jgi:hypothetical protein